MTWIDLTNPPSVIGGHELHEFVSLIAAFAMAMTGYSQSPPKVTVRLGQAVYWATEGNDTVWLSVERGNGVTQGAFTVEYATSDLTAKAEVDYEVAETNIQATSRPATQGEPEMIGVRTAVRKGKTT